MRNLDLGPGKIKHCQICRSLKLVKVINLGLSGPCDSLLSIEDLNNYEKNYPLNLYRCENCQLLQLNYVVDNKELFHLDYPYKSGITKPLKKNLFNTSYYVRKKFNFSKNPLAIDIGSNDGTLLEGFRNNNFKTLGIEPTNIAAIANKKGIRTIQKFFDFETAKFIRKRFKKAEVITGTNIFAHVNKLDAFMRGVKLILDPTHGIFVVESHYLVDIVEKLQFDSIYHEHLRFFLLYPLTRLMKMYGFKIIDAVRIPNYGGSLRVTATLNFNLPTNINVNNILKMEKKKGFYKSFKYKKFSNDIFKARKNLVNKLWNLKLRNKSIVGIGCPGRSITLLSFCGINNQILNYIAEQSSSLKLNLFTPTTHIKILNEKILLNNQPDYVLILSWHYAKSVIKNLKKKGLKSKIIIPLPKLKII